MNIQQINNNLMAAIDKTNSPAPATGIPLHHHYTEWSSGLCDCCSDCSSCCLTCWCPSITFGRIAEIVDEGSTSCAVAGALHALLTWTIGFGWLLSCLYRSKIRHRYMLKETPYSDWFVHFCCESRALCQEYRELQTRGFDMSIGWEGNMERRNGGVAMATVTTPPLMFQGGMTR